MNEAVISTRGLRKEFGQKVAVADLTLVTDRHEVHAATATATVSSTMRTEGQFVGTSSGAVLYAAIDVLSREGGTAIALLPDSGWKYLSGPPWAA